MKKIKKKSESKLMLIVFKLSMLLLLVISYNACDLKEKQKNNDNYIDTSMNYYNKEVVIIWSLPEKEREEYLKRFDAELEADIYYDFTMAQHFLYTECDKINIDVITDYEDYCGFVFENGDTVKLQKKDFEEVDEIWKIILFNGIKQPKVVSPILIEDSFYEYFNIK